MTPSAQVELPLRSLNQTAARAPRRPSRRPGDTVPTHLLSVDIETVPDEALLPPGWDREKFPKPAWHRVVAIAFAVARIDRDTDHEEFIIESCRSGGEPDWDERRLLQGFWQFFSAGCYRLVTWNGRSFDLPVLLIRAFIYGIPTGSYYLRGDRWSGYGNRYSADYHADLMDLMSQHGAATRMGLDEMALAMGLPGKAGEHGANVAELVAKDEIARVRAYCETDVLNTLALYLRWSLSTGRSSPRGHDAAMGALIDYLHREGAERRHLAGFLNGWLASRRPSPSFVSSTHTQPENTQDKHSIRRKCLD